MAQPLEVRRSGRHPEPRRHLADEQAAEREQQEEAREIDRAIAEAAATVEASDSDEHELADGECTDSDDEQKARPSQREHTAVVSTAARRPLSTMHSDTSRHTAHSPRPD